MKRIALIFLCIMIALCTAVPAFAQDQNLGYGYTCSQLCTVKEADLSEDTIEFFFSDCQGHFSNDKVTVYITNTSKDAANFQVSVGWNGDAVQTSMDSGFVTLEPGITGKFLLENISQFPEKANDDLGYVPGSKLSGSSIIRIKVTGLSPDDTFVITGIESYRKVMGSGLAAIKSSTIVKQFLIPQYISDAKLVIKDEEVVKEVETKEYTMIQPDTRSVVGFIILTVSSAILCIGGITIFTYSYITRRGKENDGEI